MVYRSHYKYETWTLLYVLGVADWRLFVQLLHFVERICYDRSQSAWLSRKYLLMSVSLSVCVCVCVCVSDWFHFIAFSWFLLADDWYNFRLFRRSIAIASVDAFESSRPNRFPVDRPLNSLPERGKNSSVATNRLNQLPLHRQWNRTLPVERRWSLPRNGFQSHQGRPTYTHTRWILAIDK